MIKIIKHGIYNNKIKCCCCDCIFTFEKEDVVTNRTNTQEWVGVVKCPECGEINNI